MLFDVNDRLCSLCGRREGYSGWCLSCCRLICPQCWPAHEKTHAAPVRTLSGEVMARKPAPRPKKRKPVPPGQQDLFGEVAKP